MVGAHRIISFYLITIVTSRIDYGNSLLANAPKIWTDKLQRVMNAAARVISGTRKFDRGLTRFLRDDLHCSVDRRCGWTSYSASSSSCVCWCSSVYTAVHRSILHLLILSVTVPLLVNLAATGSTKTLNPTWLWSLLLNGANTDTSLILIGSFDNKT